MANKQASDRPKWMSALLASIIRTLVQWPDARLVRWAAIAAIVTVPLTALGLYQQRYREPVPPKAAATVGKSEIEELAILQPHDGATVSDFHLPVVARTPYLTRHHFLIVETANGRTVQGSTPKPSPVGELEGRVTLGDAVAGAGETFTLYLIATSSSTLDPDHVPDDAVVGHAVHVTRTPLFDHPSEGDAR